eukprot:scaffold156_cov308-Prasinococcus_capsulatus_cf.AAC.10
MAPARLWSRRGSTPNSSSWCAALGRRRWRQRWRVLWLMTVLALVVADAHIRGAHRRSTGAGGAAHDHRIQAGEQGHQVQQERQGEGEGTPQVARAWACRLHPR